MPSGLGTFGIAGGDGRTAAGQGWRSIDVAVGVQCRKEKLSNSYSDLLTSGFAGFLGPNRNNAFQRDVKSVFAEADYELINGLNINAAARITAISTPLRRKRSGGRTLPPFTAALQTLNPSRGSGSKAPEGSMSIRTAQP